MGKSQPLKVVNSFKKNGESIGVGDSVLVRPQTSKEASYVAKVDKILRSGYPGKLKVRLRWFYRPEETKGGRKPFHGCHELLLSDHCDLNGIETIEGKCTVHDLQNYRKLNQVTTKDFFSRFEYMFQTGRVVPEPCSLPLFCICQMPDNPDQFMVECESCLKWYHPDCLNISIETATSVENFLCQRCISLQASETPSQFDGQPGQDRIDGSKSQECPLSIASNSGEVNKKVGIIYDPRMLEHIQHVVFNSQENPEKPDRIRHIYERLEKDDLLKWCNTYTCDEVERQHLFAVHDKVYIALIEKTSNLEEPHTTELDPKYFSEDMYFSKGTATAALLAAGGAVKACDLVAKGVHEKAFAIIRPPGHHAKKKIW